MVSYSTGSSLDGGAYSYTEYSHGTSESVKKKGSKDAHTYVPSDGCDALFLSVVEHVDKSSNKSKETGTGKAVIAEGRHHVTDRDNNRDRAEKVHVVTAHGEGNKVDRFARVTKNLHNDGAIDEPAAFRATEGGV